MPARQRILESYIEVLNTEGGRAATLETVAAYAGVSKGGLLYHFASADALATGLIDHVRGLAQDTYQEVMAAPEGPAAHYIVHNPMANRSFGQAMLAAARLTQTRLPAAGELLRSVHQLMLDAITSEVGDPVTASTILALGDGLTYTRMLGMAGEGRELDDREAAVALGVVAQLTAEARTDATA